MNARVDKAGDPPAVNPTDIHAWASKWAEHGRRRLSLFSRLSRAKGLLNNLRSLRALLDSLGGSTAPQAVVLKAQTEAAIESQIRAAELIYDELEAFARHSSRANQK
jgi:hypothetical protein